MRLWIVQLLLYKINHLILPGFIWSIPMKWATVMATANSFTMQLKSWMRKIGRLWKAIQYRQANFNEDWGNIYHNRPRRNQETGRDHGGQSDRERNTWIVTNAQNLNAHFKQQPGIVDIMPTIACFLV